MMNEVVFHPGPLLWGEGGTFSIDIMNLLLLCSESTNCRVTALTTVNSNADRDLTM